MNPGTLTLIITIGGYVIAGGLALYGIFNKSNRERERSDDQVASNLISNLERTVNILKDENLVLKNKEIEQGKDIAHLQGEVKTLTSILQGKDPSMAEFFRQAPDMIAMTKANAEAVTELASAVKNLVQKLTPQ